METPDLETLRYPIGKFKSPPAFTNEEVMEFVQAIATLPEQLQEAVTGFTEAEIDTPYRPGGWTVRQTIHHLADSHLNSYLRFRLALTEDKPTIKPYEEQLWAELTDGKQAPIDLSLTLLEALHGRWVMLLQSLTAEEWQRTFIHPASGETPLNKAAGLYAWHGQHHLAHITELKNRNFDRVE